MYPYCVKEDRGHVRPAAPRQSVLMRTAVASDCFVEVSYSGVMTHDGILRLIEHLQLTATTFDPKPAESQDQS